MDVTPEDPFPAPPGATDGATFNGSAGQRLPVLLRSIGSDVTLPKRRDLESSCP